MNLPNKLTVGRITLVPFFVAALLANFPLNNAVALIIFIAVSLTDMFDGKNCKKKTVLLQTSEKFADPLADKILVLAAFLCFVQLGICDCVAVIIVLFREFSVTSIRLIAASKGKVVAANMWGKAKTVSQMIAIIAVIAMQIVLELPEVGLNFINTATFEPIFFVVGEILIWISVVFTIISGVVYIIQNRQFISQT